MKRACKIIYTQLAPTWREEHDYEQVTPDTLKNEQL